MALTVLRPGAYHDLGILLNMQVWGRHAQNVLRQWVCLGLGTCIADGLPAEADVHMGSRQPHSEKCRPREAEGSLESVW